MKNSPRQLWLVLAITTLVGGCASGVKLDQPAPVESRTPSAMSSDPNAGSQSGITPIDQTNGKNLAAENIGRIIYFDFDSYVVKDEFRPMVETSAATLKSDHSKKVVAEGHTDERGGSEYNLALGQKRAEAVVRQMVLLGVAEAQLEAVSYGKERPAMPGSTEEAWAKNRRVELRGK